MKGHYLPLATIAWGISLYFLFGNLEFLGGHTGMTGIPALDALRLRAAQTSATIYYLIWAIALAALWATRQPARFAAGPRDPRAARAASRWPRRSASTRARLKIVVFVYAALLACISGWLYAHLQRFVNPTPFGINQGIEYLFMAVVGGAGSVWGAVVGATLITLLKQVLQDMLPHAARPQRQLRDRRVRRPDGRCCCSARATASGRGSRACCRSARRRRCPTRRRCRRAHARAATGRCSTCARARKAVRRPRRGQRPVVRDPAAARSSG